MISRRLFLKAVAAIVGGSLLPDRHEPIPAGRLDAGAIAILSADGTTLVRLPMTLEGRGDGIARFSGSATVVMSGVARRYEWATPGGAKLAGPCGMDEEFRIDGGYLNAEYLVIGGILSVDVTIKFPRRHGVTGGLLG